MPINTNSTLPVSKVTEPKAKFPTSELRNEENVSFSFKYLKPKSICCKEFNNKFFSIATCIEFISTFLEKLSHFSSFKVNELKNARNEDSTRCHPVKGKPLKLLEDILVNYLEFSPKFLNQIESEFYELTIEKSKGRFFGFIIGNVYYIVLLDPHHLLYKIDGYYAKNDLATFRYDFWKNSR